MQLGGQIFFVAKDSKNVVLGDVELALLDEQQLWAYFNSNAVRWSNSLAGAQAKVEQANKNYDALYKEDIDRFTVAKQHHDNIWQNAAVGSPESEQAIEWSKKLEKKISDLQEMKKTSDEGKTLNHAIWERAFLWNQINWPSITDLFAGGLTNIQTTTTDAEGRFKFEVPSSSPDLVLFEKAERKLGETKEKYWWLNVVAAPNEGNLESSIRSTDIALKNSFWLPSVYLKGKTTEVILSNNNKSEGGVWYYLENTNAAKYISHIGVEIDVAD